MLKHVFYIFKKTEKNKQSKKENVRFENMTQMELLEIRW